MRNASGLLLLVVAHACQPTSKPAPETSILQPTVAYGFVTYFEYDSHLNFVPLKDATKATVTPGDFTTERLGRGFGFRASQRVQDELRLLPHYAIHNQLRDVRLTKYKGTSTYIPVRLVYELDPRGQDVLKSTFSSVDTVTFGTGRYEKEGETVTFLVESPGADVLKVGPVR